MIDISVYVRGEAKGQPRPRAFAMKGKNGSKPAIRMYEPGTAEGWKGQIADAFKPHLPDEPHTGPVKVSLAFFAKRPKNQFRTGKHADELRPDAPTLYVKKPDADNLAKAVLDALTVLQFWKDDDQVVDLIVRRRWVNPGNAPGCWVKVKSMKEEDHV